MINHSAVWGRVRLWIGRLLKIYRNRDAFKYIFLLLSLSSLTWSGAYWAEGDYIPQKGIDWEDLNVLLVLFFGIYAISRRRALMIVSICLAVFANAAAWTSELTEQQGITIASDILMTLFFVYTACVILVDLGRTRRVTVDTIVGSVCAYILLGVAFGFIYSLIELLLPGSFSSSAAAPGEAVMQHRDYPALIYYSFVTLSSLGYGDIVPVKRAARMISWTEGVMGQFYMAVLVARLVSLHLTHARDQSSGADERNNSEVEASTRSS